MTADLHMTLGVARTVFAVLTWLAIGGSVHSFFIGHVVNGVIRAVIGVALLIVTADGRVLRRADGHPLPTAGVVVLGLFAIVLVASELMTLRFVDVSLLGQAYGPGIVQAITAIGALLLAVLLLLETWGIVRRAR